MGFKVTVAPKFRKLLKGGLVDETRKEFSKRGPVKVKQAIIQDMIKGISPVKGGGKYKKYSDSYKKAIKAGYVGSKRPTPVNLRVTGELHRSLTSFFKGRSLFIQFKSFLADIHNRQGAGKSKAVRRMLPTNEGEQFNRRINSVIFGELKKAVDKVAKRFSGQ